MRFSKFSTIPKILFIFCLLLVFLILESRLTAQTILKVHQVIDANLFLTSSGDSLQLIGVCSPSIYSKDVRERALAQKVKKFAFEKLTDDRCYLEPMDTTQSGKILVMAFQHFPLQKKNLNLEFLKQGFARYSPHPAIQDTASFLKVQQEAKLNGLGIWGLEKYGSLPANFFHYFKISGGALGVHRYGAGEDDILLPLVSVGYHYGDLLKFQTAPNNYLTLSAQVNALWAIILPIAQIGAEFYLQNLRFGLFTGKVIPIIGAFYFDTERKLITHSLEIGKRSIKANGQWHEVDFVFYWLPDHDGKDDFVFKIELNLPLF